MSKTETVKKWLLIVTLSVICGYKNENWDRKKSDFWSSCCLSFGVTKTKTETVKKWLLIVPFVCHLELQKRKLRPLKSDFYSFYSPVISVYKTKLDTVKKWLLIVLLSVIWSYKNENWDRGSWSSNVSGPPVRRSKWLLADKIKMTISGQEQKDHEWGLTSFGISINRSPCAFNMFPASYRLITVVITVCLFWCGTCSV